MRVHVTVRLLLATACLCGFVAGVFAAFDSRVRQCQAGELNRHRISVVQSTANATIVYTFKNHTCTLPLSPDRHAVPGTWVWLWWSPNGHRCGNQRGHDLCTDARTLVLVWVGMPLAACLVGCCVPRRTRVQPVEATP